MKSTAALEAGAVQGHSSESSTRGHVQLRGRRRAAGQRVGRVALGRWAVAVFALTGRPLHLREVGPLPLPALLLQLHAFLRVGLAPRLLLLHLLRAAGTRAGESESSEATGRLQPERRS